MPIPNPWILLGLLVAWVISLCGAGYVGFDYGSSKAERQCSELKDIAYADLAEQLVQASGRAALAEAAARDAATRRRNAQTSLAPRFEGLRNGTPIPGSCLADDVRLQLSAVIATSNAYPANTKADYTLKLPGKLPAASGTSGQGKVAQ